MMHFGDFNKHNNRPDFFKFYLISQFYTLWELQWYLTKVTVSVDLIFTLIFTKICVSVIWYERHGNILSFLSYKFVLYHIRKETFTGSENSEYYWIWVCTISHRFRFRYISLRFKFGHQLVSYANGHPWFNYHQCPTH